MSISYSKDATELTLDTTEASKSVGKRLMEVGNTYSLTVTNTGDSGDYVEGYNASYITAYRTFDNNIYSDHLYISSSGNASGQGSPSLMVGTSETYCATLNSLSLTLDGSGSSLGKTYLSTSQFYISNSSNVNIFKADGDGVHVATNNYSFIDIIAKDATSSSSDAGYGSQIVFSSSSSVASIYHDAYSTQNRLIFSTGIKITGTVEATSYNATSDVRKKKNIIDYSPEKSILDLPIKKFDFIDGPKNQIGCIAQDLQEICPEIVTEDDDGYLSIQENKLVYLLLDEVKKLRKEVDDLKRGN